MPALELAMPGAATNSRLRKIEGVEIFRAGKWNGDDYTIADLDEMARAFSDIGYSVPLKLSQAAGTSAHDEGGPAYGWVSRVYRMGDVLKADFKDIPSWLFSAITEDHAYDQVSAEVYWNLQRNDKTYKRALKAVALLGAETPAVSGLKPIRDAYFAASSYEKVTTHSIKVSKPMPDPVANKDDVKQLTTALEAANAQIAKLTEKAAETDTLRATVKSLTDTTAALLATQAVNDVKARVQTCKIPALHEPLRHLYSLALGDGERVVKFTTDATKGETKERKVVDILDDVVEWANKIAGSVTTTTVKRHSTRPGDARPGGDNDSVTTYADASIELRDRTRKYMAEKNLKGDKYGEAMRAVLTADPALAEQYAEFTRSGPAN